MKRLDLCDLTKRFGETRVLDGVSLSISEGEFVSILGPSGAGKSTILKILIGGVARDSGEIRIDGERIDSDYSRFAFLPQRDALMPWRRIIDNLTLGLEVQGMRRAEARKVVAPMLDEFGLAGFERHYPDQLSGGMRQRAALLRTVAMGRDVLLLDEPFGALDALTRISLQRWLDRMRQSHGWTVLLITHDVREAVMLSDRIYVLSPRPARVAREFAVPLPHPRDADDLRRAAEIEAEVLASILGPHEALAANPLPSQP